MMYVELRYYNTTHGEYNQDGICLPTLDDATILFARLVWLQRHRQVDADRVTLTDLATVRVHNAMIIMINDHYTTITTVSLCIP